MSWFALAAAAMATTTSGSVTLSCTLLPQQAQSLSDKDFYRVPPTDRERFKRDIWEYGLLGMVISPAGNWVINYDAGTVTQSGSGFEAMQITEIKPDLILAQTLSDGPLRTLRIDRMTGRATVIANVDVEEWNNKFQGRLPTYRMWDLQCRETKALF